MSKILLTGGGTAGHATPNIAIMPYLKEDGHDIVYVGTKNGIERSLVEKTGVKYYAISAGKFRRYFSLENFTDIFRVLKGFGEAKAVIKNEKPDVVFSKGGFVTVPVVFAAKSKKIPVVVHESDITPGLANKLCIPKAARVCVSFESTKSSIKESKCILTGLPVRQELLDGDKKRGLDFLSFNGEKPVLLIIGGSLGAQAVNEVVDDSVKRLLSLFDIAHIRGKGKLNNTLNSMKGYRQFEYISDELGDLLAAADLVLSRAGANVIFELLAVKKPMLLIPLPKESSRGDQVLNAAYFESEGFAHTLEQSELKPERLINELQSVLSASRKMIESMNDSDITSGTKNVINAIYSVMK